VESGVVGADCIPRPVLYAGSGVVMETALPPSSLAQVEGALNRLTSGKDSWVRVGIPDRIAYLRRCAAGILEVAAEWVRLACHAKSIDPRSPLAGEEWISGPMVTLRLLRLLTRALEHEGRPRPPAIRQREDGRLVATVMPADLYDRLLFPGFRAELWLEPGRPASQGRIYRDKAAGRQAAGRVGLVLGAGNIAAIPPTDVLHKLFVEDQVVVLKMNPVNEYLGPLLERAFESLVEDGYLAVVYGGADVGSELCHDPRVDTVHLTGSDRTHDAIVWGADPEQQTRRKAQGAPLLNKPFSSELGCVTPVLVVPGAWRAVDLDFQARHVAAMVAHNASFNCNAAKVLVTARGWEQRDAFRERVEHHLTTTPPRAPYYPGAHDRYAEFLSRYPDARQLGRSDGGAVPWTILPDVPARRGQYALTHEAFCGVLATVDVDAAEAPDFLGRAVEFVNDAVWGTLSCVVLVDPRTQRRHAAAFDRAVSELRYGGIGINAWAGVNFALGATSWGAFPGHVSEDIGSGRGVVHNTFLFDHPEKSIVRAPFRPHPKPVWFVGHKSLDTLGRRLTRFEAEPSFAKLPGIAIAAFRG